MRLRDRLPVLWQEPTQVRIGTDPRWSVVLADLSPGAVRGLLGAPPGVSDRALRAALGREGVTRDEADAVVAQLATAHLLVPESARGSSDDAPVLGLLESDGSAVAVLERRAAARVRVCGLGRLGATLTTALAAAGIGHLDLDDAGPVTRAEVGGTGYTPADVGRPRGAALATVVQRASEGAHARPVAGGVADLVVLVEHHVADPTRHRPLVTDGAPHLSVVLREASVLVGPLVEPGRSACLRCVDLHRTDRDPHWPTIAAQLAVLRPAAEESMLAAVAGTLAAAQVIARVDGRASPVTDGAFEVRLPDLVPRLISWAPHPDCGCTGL